MSPRDRRAAGVLHRLSGLTRTGGTTDPGRFRVVNGVPSDSTADARVRPKIPLGAALITLGLLAAFPAVAGESPVERARLLAERVADLVETEGINGARRVLHESRQYFRDDELYAWVLDSYGIVVLHPDPVMIGLDLLRLKDLNGRVFIAEILLHAHSEDRFWDDYVGVNPETNRVTVKRQRIIKVGDHIVGAGAWVDP